jgi:hypothetical protein
MTGNVAAILDPKGAFATKIGEQNCHCFSASCVSRTPCVLHVAAASGGT